MAYSHVRVAPIEQHAAQLQAALDLLTPLVHEGVLRDLQHHPPVGGALGQIVAAQRALETMLRHTLPMLKQELEAALAEQTQVGVM